MKVFFLQVWDKDYPEGPFFYSTEAETFEEAEKKLLDEFYDENYYDINDVDEDEDPGDLPNPLGSLDDLSGYEYYYRLHSHNLKTQVLKLEQYDIR